MLKPLALALVAVLALAGCRSTRYVDPNAGQGITTTGEINPQDWTTAAEQLVSSLLASGVLDTQDGSRRVLMIGDVVNNTTQRVDTDLLTKKIRASLNEAGKVYVTTAVGLNGPEDESSMAVREGLRGNAEFNQTTVPVQGQMIAPDYSLSGKLIEQNVRAGRTRQTTFSFQLALTEIRTGLARWEAEREITKLGNRPAVSW